MCRAHFLEATCCSIYFSSDRIGLQQRARDIHIIYSLVNNRITEIPFWINFFQLCTICVNGESTKFNFPGNLYDTVKRLLMLSACDMRKQYLARILGSCLPGDGLSARIYNPLGTDTSREKSPFDTILYHLTHVFSRKTKRGGRVRVLSL